MMVLQTVPDQLRYCDSAIATTVEVPRLASSASMYSLHSFVKLTFILSPG
ncbi:MAG TPA: hypothetical protein VKM55_05585 [Candidatus Lokiarchaeia archaeon]|nr:hypothetical protein [Candidatus Lokiarchaeia archaeon]